MQGRKERPAGMEVHGLFESQTRRIGRHMPEERAAYETALIGLLAVVFVVAASSAAAALLGY